MVALGDLMKDWNFDSPLHNKYMNNQLRNKPIAMVRMEKHLTTKMKNLLWPGFCICQHYPIWWQLFSCLMPFILQKLSSKVNYSALENLFDGKVWILYIFLVMMASIYCWIVSICSLDATSVHMYLFLLFYFWRDFKIVRALNFLYHGYEASIGNWTRSKHCLSIYGKNYRLLDLGYTISMVVT